MTITPLINGNYYHIYNRGNNSDDVFYENKNYSHFLRLYEKYIDPIAETYAWCLLKNHFHFLIYVKEEKEINSTLLTYSTVEKPKIISASKQFSHFFNAYTQAINKQYKRTGSLFEKNFERKLVDTDEYFRKLIFYIHHNPVHHGFIDTMALYPWSSYNSVISNKSTKLQRNSVIEIFDDLENFKYYHSINQDMEKIKHLLIE